MKKITDLQLRHLETKHQMLDTEVEHLLNRVHLTPLEHQQLALLKKRKLRVKDGIAALRHDLQR
jgi:hypothetical protein